MINKDTLQRIKYSKDYDRQTGRTTTLVLAARAVKNAVFVTHNLNSAIHIKKEYNVDTCSFHRLKELPSDKVLFYDHLVVEMLADGMLNMHEKNK